MIVLSWLGLCILHLVWNIQAKRLLVYFTCETGSTSGPLVGLGSTALSRTDRQSDRKRILKTPNLFSGAKKNFFLPLTLCQFWDHKKRENKSFVKNKPQTAKMQKFWECWNPVKLKITFWAQYQGRYLRYTKNSELSWNFQN